MASEKYDQLLKEYNLLAMRADKRLQRLEQHSKDKHFEHILDYAYSKAMHDIHSWSGAQGTRFLTKPPANTQQLQAKIADIKEFLESKTSTKSGVKATYIERAKTTNKNWGTNFTWQDLATFWESEDAKKLASDYGSKTLIKALGIIKKLGDDPEKIKKAIESNKKLSGDDIQDEITRSLLNQGYTADRLFK